MDYPKRLQGRSLPRLLNINQVNNMEIYIVQTKYIQRSEKRNAECSSIDCFSDFAKAYEFIKVLSELSNVEVTKLSLQKQEVK